MLAKFDTSYLPKTKHAQCTFIFCSLTLLEFNLQSVHHDCNSEFTWISKLNGCSSYDQYYDNLTKIHFSADLQNRDTRRVPTEVESGLGILKSNRDSGFSSRIGTILPNLGQLDAQLCRGFREVRGNLLP